MNCIEKKRIIALDVGDKRIGIAVSDPLGWTAQGLETYSRKDQNSDIEHILKVAGSYEGAKLLFGMPRNMNGTYGPQSEKVRAFADAVAQRFEGEIVFFDERLTTAAAEKILISSDVSRKKRRAVIDKMAAVVILQGYLDMGSR